MGVDYTTHYGIGFKINIDPTELQGEMDLDVDAYLSEVLPSDVSYFEVGSRYEDNDGDYYVIIDDGLDKGWENAKLSCEELKARLEQEGLIDATDEPSVVGGLEIW